MDSNQQMMDETQVSMLTGPFCYNAALEFTKGEPIQCPICRIEKIQKYIDDVLNNPNAVLDGQNGQDQLSDQFKFISFGSPTANSPSQSSDKKLRSNSKKSLKPCSRKSNIHLNNVRITRAISAHLQEVNTTRHRYELSGGSPLKWIKSNDEFDRPLTKEGSLRYEREAH